MEFHYFLEGPNFKKIEEFHRRFLGFWGRAFFEQNNTGKGQRRPLKTFFCPSARMPKNHRLLHRRAILTCKSRGKLDVGRLGGCCEAGRTKLEDVSHGIDVFALQRELTKCGLKAPGRAQIG